MNKHRGFNRLLRLPRWISTLNVGEIKTVTTSLVDSSGSGLRRNAGFTESVERLSTKTVAAVYERVNKLESSK